MWDSHPLYDRSRLDDRNTWSRLPGSLGEVTVGETILVDGVHPVKVELNDRKGWHIRLPGNGFVRRLYPNGVKPIEPFELPPPIYSPRPPTPNKDLNTEGGVNVETNSDRPSTSSPPTNATNAIVTTRENPKT